MENRIRALRKQRGITMKQLGEVVDLAESTISQYETGKREPDNETLLKISEYFGVTVGYLLGVETDTSTAKNNHDILDDADVAFYGTFKGLSEAGKETLRAMARILKEQETKDNR